EPLAFAAAPVGMPALPLPPAPAPRSAKGKSSLDFLGKKFDGERKEARDAGVGRGQEAIIRITTKSSSRWKELPDGQEPREAGGVAWGQERRPGPRRGRRCVWHGPAGSHPAPAADAERGRTTRTADEPQLGGPSEGPHERGDGCETCPARRRAEHA